MNNYQDKLSSAINKVYEKLSSMPDEEFFSQLEKHLDSDITNALLAMDQCCPVPEPTVINVGWDIFNEATPCKNIAVTMKGEGLSNILFKPSRKCASVCTGFGENLYSETFASSDDYLYDIAA